MHPPVRSTWFTEAPEEGGLGRRIGWAALLAGLIVAAYWPALGGAFLWDDDSHITANPVIIGPLGLREIWTTAAANYFPLVLTNFWLQHACWGLEPLGYHAVTIGFHALAAVLLWRVLVRLQVPGAWLGAALWALHPVQVESVAWICELKNTQSAVFFLLAVRFFLKWLAAAEGPAIARAGEGSDSPPKRRGSGIGVAAEVTGQPRPTQVLRRFEAWSGALDRAAPNYALMLASAVLALLSKPSTVMLPPVLLLLAWWRRGSFDWRVARWLVPCFALSAVAAGWTIWEQKFHSGAAGVEWSQPWAERLAIAGHAIWFYLGKLAWPHPLVFIYPRWEFDLGRAVTWFAPLMAILVLGLLAWRRHGRLRPVFVTALYFGALLFPVLGFFDVYFFRYSYVGDHFQHLASMGPLALAAAGCAVAGRRFGATAAAGAALLVLGLGVLTWRQTRVYANNETLWRDTLAHNDGAAMAWLNLGDTLAKQGRHREAIDCFRRATQINPGDPDGWNDLGCELILDGLPGEALPVLERALQLKPGFAAVHNNLGNALRALGRAPEAMEHYRRAIALKPDYGEPHNNLGAELAEAGRAEEALPHFEAALRIDPRHAEALDNFGNALRRLGRPVEAIARHEAALQLRPDQPSTLNNLGLALVAAGRPAEAIARYERALQLQPGNLAIRANLARALVAEGRVTEGFRQLEEAVRLAPDSAEAHLNLGAALAEAGRMPDALAHFTEAVRLAPAMASGHTNLGMAFAAAGRWSEAVRHFETAVRLEPGSAAGLGQLGVALVNAERLADAVPVFERALKLSPGSAELHGNLGQLLRALGRNREAFEHLEAAATLQRAAPRGR